MFGISTNDPVTALAVALTYWVFRCRSKTTSPAMGLKTWTYLQSSITNASLPARQVDDYIAGLCQRLIVPHLNPMEWSRIIAPKQRILRAQLNEDGTVRELQEMPELESYLPLQWAGWEDLMRMHGISERQILALCRTKSYLVASYCRVRHEEEKALNLPELETEAIDAQPE